MLYEMTTRDRVSHAASVVASKFGRVLGSVVASISLLAAIHASAAEVPQFRDYPSMRTNHSAPAPLQLTEQDAKFRTRLRVAARERPNFAGSFILTTWGCGTSCLMGAAINKGTGRIVWIPFSICCATPVDARFSPIEYRSNSRLIVFAGLRNEEGPMGAHFYEFNGHTFRFLMTVPDDGSFSRTLLTPNLELPRFKRGQSYALVQESLLALGWIPARPKGQECDGHLCTQDKGEIMSCAGTGLGQCRMLWRKGETLIEITTIDEFAIFDGMECRSNCPGGGKGPLLAVETQHIWVTGGGQGTYEHSILNMKGDAFRIVNAVAAEPGHGGKCAISLEVSNVAIGNKLSGSKITLYVAVDGMGTAFMLENGEAWDVTSSQRNEIHKLILLLRKTKARNFDVSIPEIEYRATFSTRGASKNLQDALEGCN